MDKILIGDKNKISEEDVVKANAFFQQEQAIYDQIKIRDKHDIMLHIVKLKNTSPTAESDLVFIIEQTAKLFKHKLNERIVDVEKIVAEVKVMQ